MKNNKKSYVVHPLFETQKKINPVVLRFILSNEFTRVDFGYAAPWMYIKGGWIHIAPHAYLAIDGSPKKYALMHTENIPIAPQKHEFETTEDWKVFSLFFEPLPIQDCVVNLIEEENPSENDFNYYALKLKNVLDVEIIP
jgi:hypothetical protein